MLQIGSLVDGKYKILSRIGQGGMSVVYMAINEKANKTWAIKEVRKDGVLDFEAVKQGLIAETDMLKKLNHPHLPSIIDVIEDDNSFLIVMDYIEGISLKKQLDEYGAQSQQDVVKWSMQLCEVFVYLHSRPKPIIYRDMKPGNVMLKPNGDVVLIDFGTAREFKATSVEDTKCLGTIGYAAPEQFGKMGQTDARTDIYCLGATMYHLLTGCYPCAEPPYEIVPIRQINSSLSPGLEQIILKCTQQNPDNRYQSAAELLYALENYEQFDGNVRKKQKRKLATFLTCAGLSLACLGTAIGLGIAADSMASENYDMVMFEAQVEPNEELRVQKYMECIDIPTMEGRADAYLEIFETFKSDGAFLQNEADIASRIVKDTVHVDALMKEPETYAEICFSLGNLYWYYYENDQLERAKAAMPWFDKAISYGPEGWQYMGTAKAYAAIGHFYTNITIAINEANDYGMYKELFVNISEVVDTIANNPNERDLVRLEIYAMARNMLEQYATSLKKDGISREDAIALCQRIQDQLPGVPAPNDKCEELKNSTMSRLDITREKLETAYGT